MLSHSLATLEGEQGFLFLYRALLSWESRWRNYETSGREMVLHSKTWPQTALILTMQKPDMSSFWIPTVAETQTKYYLIYSGWSYNNIRMLDWIITSYELTTIVWSCSQEYIQTIPCRLYLQYDRTSIFFGRKVDVFRSYSIVKNHHHCHHCEKYLVMF